MDGDDEFKAQLREVKFDLRSKMQHVQLQFDILKQAVDTCDVSVIETNLEECMSSIDTTLKESSKFIQYNIELLEEIGNLRKLVISRMKKTRARKKR